MQMCIDDAEYLQNSSDLELLDIRLDSPHRLVSLQLDLKISRLHSMELYNFHSLLGFEGYYCRDKCYVKWQHDGMLIGSILTVPIPMMTHRNITM